MKGKPCPRDIVEFVDITTASTQMGPSANRSSWKGNPGERFFLGTCRINGEAIVGSPEGVRRVSTNRRVGAHRRWDASGPSAVRGLSWSWKPEAKLRPGNLHVRYLRREDLRNGTSMIDEDEHHSHRLQRRREDLLEHDFADGCRGCQATLSWASRQGRSELRRQCFETATHGFVEGQVRVARLRNRENDKLAWKIDDGIANDSREKTRRE